LPGDLSLLALLLPQLRPPRIRVVSRLAHGAYDRGCDRRDGWVGLSSEPNLRVGHGEFSTRAKGRAPGSARMGVCDDMLDTADIVREAATCVHHRGHTKPSTLRHETLFRCQRIRQPPECQHLPCSTWRSLGQQHRSGGISAFRRETPKWRTLQSAYLLGAQDGNATLQVPPVAARQHLCRSPQQFEMPAILPCYLLCRRRLLL
jgi:hypothetical protein